MIKNTFIFLGTFVIGALAALAVRAASFKPHADANPTAHTTEVPAAVVDHSQHASPAAAAPAPTTDAEKPVNTVCAICGMPVDPKVPTLEYKGKRIGFGCRMCPPKFKADPDKYGPYYLRNEVIKR